MLNEYFFDHFDDGQIERFIEGRKNGSTTEQWDPTIDNKML
jgi:hypothetical protein